MLDERSFSLYERKSLGALLIVFLTRSLSSPLRRMISERKYISGANNQKISLNSQDEEEAKRKGKASERWEDIKLHINSSNLSLSRLTPNGGDSSLTENYVQFGGVSANDAEKLCGWGKENQWRRAAICFKLVKCLIRGWELLWGDGVACGC